MSARSGSLLGFALVGLSATGVHVAVGLILVWSGLFGAFFANVLAFSVAFMVSYFGHHRFSFRSTAQHRSAMPRFLAVAAFGLALNQAIVFGMVDLGHLRYELALVVIVGTVPAVTYVLSRIWAFAGSTPAREPGAAG